MILEICAKDLHPRSGCLYTLTKPQAPGQWMRDNWGGLQIGRAEDKLRIGIYYPPYSSSVDAPSAW